MAISRMQQPRQMYGLGSLVKKAVKGVTGAVKSVAKSDLGKLALAGGAIYGLGTGGFKNPFEFGKILPNLGGLIGLKPGADNLLGNVAKVGLAGTVLGGALSGYGGEEEEATIGGERNVEALRAKLTQAYRNLRFPEEQIPGLVENDLAEYTMGAGGYAEGGRIGYALGDRAEDNAMQASGIMGLPLNQNPAGVTELDLRDSGGFIPPVGVKEKADDIPAMLSNNEFVFTADAVRGMGDGDVNKGAERMYSMMKTLENGGRV